MSVKGEKLAATLSGLLNGLQRIGTRKHRRTGKKTAYFQKCEMQTEEFVTGEMEPYPALFPCCVISACEADGEQRTATASTKRVGNISFSAWLGFPLRVLYTYIFRSGSHCRQWSSRPRSCHTIIVSMQMQM